MARAFCLVSVCESPIEVELGSQLGTKAVHGYDVVPQFKWLRYRMDFAILRRDAIVAFIECDGAEFHSTDAQIRNDTKKNDAAREAGIIMFRFSGAQIFRNAGACADFVWGLISP
jgi:very-short-patch-repair endonuclease